MRSPIGVSRRQNQGFVLLAVIIALSVLGALSYALMQNSGVTTRASGRALEAERARLLAEAGLAHALRDMQQPMRAQNTVVVCTRNRNFTLNTAGQSDYLTGTLAGVGTYTVAFERQTDDARGPRPLLLVSRAMLNGGASYTLSLPLPALSFDLPRSGTSAIAVLARSEKDAFVRSTQANVNFNKDPAVSTDLLEALQIDGPGGKEEQVLVQFGLADFPGFVGSHVIHARLGLFQTAGQTAGATITAHRITQEWMGDDVTWNKRNSTDAWTTAGGSHDAAAMGAMITVSGAAGMRWMALDPDMVAAANNGLLLRVAGNTRFEFRGTRQENRDSSWSKLMRAPKLEVVYLSTAACPP